MPRILFATKIVPWKVFWYLTILMNLISFPGPYLILKQRGEVPLKHGNGLDCSKLLMLWIYWTWLWHKCIFLLPLWIVLEWGFVFLWLQKQNEPIVGYRYSPFLDFFGDWLGFFGCNNIRVKWMECMFMLSDLYVLQINRFVGKNPPLGHKRCRCAAASF